MDNKCRKANKLINGYIDDNLNPKDKDFFEEHIKECTNCRESYEALKLLIKDISETGLQAPPADFSAKLHIRLAQEAQNSRKTIFNIRPYVNVAVSAALVCAVAFGANVYKNYSEQMQNDLTGNIASSKTETKQDTTAEAVTDVQLPETANVTAQKQSPVTDIKEYETQQHIAVVNETSDLTIPAPEATAEVAETEAVTEYSDAVNEPAYVTDETSHDTPARGGGGSSGSSAFMRKSVFYAEYMVDLTTKPELIEQIKTEFNVTEENTLICNDDEFNTLVEFLNNNDLFLDFRSERTSDNLITFKCT